MKKPLAGIKNRSYGKKVLFSAGCLGVASASAAVGGAAGAAIATAAFTGTMGQRMLGGLATFVTAEGLLKKSAEKGGRERGKWEARRHTAEAAILGILVGSGKFAEGIKNIAEVTGAKDFLAEAYRYWFPKEEIVKMPPLAGGAKIEADAPVAPEAPAVASVVEVQKGDTVWKLAEKQLEERGLLGELNSEQKNFIIDSITRRVEVPSGDVDLIRPGETIDFGNVFKDYNIDDQLKNFRVNGGGFSGTEDAPDTAGGIPEKAPIEATKVVPEPPVKAPATEAVPENKLADLEKKYSEARLKLSEANAKSYTSDLPSDEADADINKYYKESADLEKQIQELKLSDKPKVSGQEVLESKKPTVSEQVAINPKTGGESIQEAVKSAAEAQSIIPKEKMAFLENLVYKDDHLIGFKLKTLVGQINSGKLTVEDFSKYYASKVGAERVSDEMLDGFKYNFKAISGTNAVERLKAEGIMSALLKRLESIK